MLAEQLVLVMHPRWMVQVDDTTPLDDEQLTAVVPVTTDSKTWIDFNREMKETFDCTDEDVADRKVRRQTAKLPLTIRVTPDIGYAFIAAARGNSAAPVAVGGGDYTHASARKPAYDFELPATTMMLAGAGQDTVTAKRLRAVRCISFELVGDDGDYWTMNVVLDVYPVYTDVEDFPVPACADQSFLDTADSETLVDAVSIENVVFDSRISYDNNMREGRYRFTNAGKNPTRAHRGARRTERMDLTLSIDPDHAISQEVETGTQTDHVVVRRLGTATRYIQFAFPKARFEGNVTPDGDQRPLVTKVGVIPLKTGGTTSTVTARNTVSQQYLPEAA